ncbi:hypothetical protein Salat_2029800 [Sesamum alatum]|uniref:DUF4408 domain-containing protein n=1 Tax=Sesamum alatum TaxID=300844 RepID=A0AAE1Y0B6_9LAMI|nr:hypothetical protein Salat_2029800 [Sesamum alatum]
MEKQLQKSLKLLPIALLLIITPLLSTSLRLKYLYFIVNILIIAVGAEAGLLSFFLNRGSPPDVVDPPALSTLSQETAAVTTTSANHILGADHDQEPAKKRPAVEKCSSETILVGVRSVANYKFKKSRSTPSIFFVEGGEDDDDDDDDDGVEEVMMVENYKCDQEAGDVSDDHDQQELFQKAERFIGNFYKELKMQREESWKKLHASDHDHHHLSHKP